MNIKRILILSAIAIGVYYLFINKKKIVKIDSTKPKANLVVNKVPTDIDVIGQKYILIREYKGKMIYPQGSIFRKRNENNALKNAYLLEYNNENIFDEIPSNLLDRQ